MGKSSKNDVVLHNLQWLHVTPITQKFSDLSAYAADPDPPWPSLTCLDQLAVLLQGLLSQALG